MKRPITATLFTVLALGATSSPSAAQPFVAPFAGTKAVIWAVGDGADGSPGGKSVAALISADRVDRFLYLGDVYPRGTADEFQRNYAGVYGGLAAVTAPTPGNHEWDQAQYGYLPYWESQKGVPTPWWYATRAAGWQLLSLNSEVPHGRDSEQIGWLRRKLAATPRFGNCRLAFFHRPLYSGGPFADPTMIRFWEVLKGRTRLVLNGHEHNMQRFASIDGIVEIISGAGAGHSNVYPTPGLLFADSSTLGALRVVLTRRLARFEAVSASGVVLDSGRVRCRPQDRVRPSGQSY